MDLFYAQLVARDRLVCRNCLAGNFEPFALGLLERKDRATLSKEERGVLASVLALRGVLVPNHKSRARRTSYWLPGVGTFIVHHPDDAARPAVLHSFYLRKDGTLVVKAQACTHGLPAVTRGTLAEMLAAQELSTA